MALGGRSVHVIVRSMSRFSPLSVSAGLIATALLAGCAAQSAGGPGPRDAALAVERPPPAYAPEHSGSVSTVAPEVMSGTDLGAASDSGSVGGGDVADQTPAPPAPAVGAVESLDVPASGDPVTFKTTLPAGEIALLRASGTVELGGQKLDAEFSFGAGEPADRAGGADLGVDIGLPQIHPMVHTTPTPSGPGRMKWFGPYRTDHVYAMTVTSEGKPLTLKLTRPAGAGGTGSITVALIPLSLAPPKIGDALDAVMVPITKTVVASTLTTDASKLYLLQASGSGQVGGGGTHLGDAEYMDWDEAGTRKNEGEAGADFGIGVDETAFPRMRGDAYQPRQRWWGPWRRDHTYYMVFAGTGRPIQFLYFDSGYGDNSPTDKLTVRIFALP
jgi:hypothetical protein